MGERTEALLRIVLSIVYGLISYIWSLLIGIIWIIHWLYVLVVGKRNQGMAEFANKYVSYIYNVNRYILFTTNQRAWPLGDSELKEMDEVDLE